MKVFIVLCVVMATVAIMLVVRPLLKTVPDAAGGNAAPAKPGKLAAIATAILLPLLAVWLYMSVTTWQWNAPLAGTAQGNPNAPQIEAMVVQLEERLKNEPQDAEGWLMLGRAYVMLAQYPRAVDAFQQAYDLTKGENLSAITGLAEALILTDQTALNGRASELIEAALVKSPREPRALWYGSLSALNAGKLEVARDRMQLLLDQNPPEQVRSLLQTQISDINAQLGAPASAEAVPAAATASVAVAVSIAPEIAARIGKPQSLFVLARTAAGGPPVAVVRLTSDKLPLNVELGESNAMIPGRGIGSVPEVQIVARISQSGSPQAQSGDFYGEADYVVQPGRGSVNIVIDRVVP